MFWVGLILISLNSFALTHKVKIEGMKFIPSHLIINSGDSIEWENNDLVPHTASALDKNFDSKIIPPKSRWKGWFNNTGDFSYQCKLHPLMRGSIMVK